MGRAREDDREADVAGFSLGVDYWPGRSALALWQRFDADELREDFAHIAALGLAVVRFFVRWDDFQPQPGAPEPAMLARLVALVDLAAGAGLRTIPTLFCGAMDGQVYLPDWARGRDLYTGALLEEQLVFARAAGERLRAHPAILAWDIGHRFTDVWAPRRGSISTGGHGSTPAAEREIATWSRRLTDALRETSAIGTTAGTFAGDLTADRRVRFDSLCMPFAFASMQGAPDEVPVARGPLDPEALPFLAMLTAGFSHHPVFMTGVQAPDSTENVQAIWCTQVLDRLQADGRLGALWWWAGAHGIVRPDGSEKPLAHALAAFARQQRPLVAARDMPMISSTYYYRTLPTSMTTLYDAYLAFVAERRGGADA
ncbi:MAG: hypothetical protein ABR975_08545 [Vulcanimicrobiaceae bacterium]